VNDAALTTLKGNTHPLAQAQFDRGAAPPDLPMARMLLVLKRSDAQDAALEKLLDDQQDQSSPSYHQWLTPDQFGQQFGPSDQDIQAVTLWLRSHGFQIGQVGRGRAVIEFSGTALQVQQTFHAEIRKFTVNGEDHWANASDPQIPDALSPVVEGVVSLHNFPKQHLHRVTGIFSKSRATGKVQALNPDFTLLDPNNCHLSGGNCYLVGPYDFAKIYKVDSLWNESPAIDGAGQSIAVVGVSNINIQDVRDFRNLFGLPANDPQVILNGTDPGLVPGAETEADLDVEWSGAVARGAIIKLVVSAPTNSIDGVDLSALYVVENKIAPILSESFGDCELFLGTAGNAFENAIREQGAAEGITYINSGGDEGSARCDRFSGTSPDPVTYGLTVNGLASSPHGVAVGGTDFANFPNITSHSPSPYWAQNNDGLTKASVLGYVPETTWNQSCTNAAYVSFNWGSNAEAVCNNSQLTRAVWAVGGGGGKSNCITSDGTNVSSCTGGYAKPSWQQSAPGVPADGARDIPDISLFASGGFMDSAYILCEADQVNGQSCSLTGLDSTFLGVGGTSASAPAFAGMMALVNQYTNSAGQGNANYVLYKLASMQSQRALNCNASSTPATGCIFNDVTAGTIAMPCASGSPDCTVSSAGDAFGVLNGYSAGTGYDLATGLGSVNAYNLVHNWSSPAISTSTTLSINSGKPVSITHGQTMPLSVSVTPTAATGQVSLLGVPGGSGSIPMGDLTLANGAASGTTATLAGGNSYAVKAHYAGDATYAPSDSSPVTVTVSPEPSTTLITIPVFDPTTHRETGNTPASLVYGSPYIARMDVGNANAKVAFPMKPVCAPFTCPTGSVTFSDSVSGGALGVFPLNAEGNAEYFTIQLTGGSHQLSASYPGDNSYSQSSGTYALLVTPAPTLPTVPYIPQYPEYVGSTVPISTRVSSNFFTGAIPTGTITFYDGATAIPGTVTLNGTAGIPNAIYPTLTGSINTVFMSSGNHTITATFSGDANYESSTSNPWSLPVYCPTTATATVSPSTIYLGQSVSITATISGICKSPQMTGTFQFSGDPSVQSLGPVTPTPGTDSTGDQVLTATITVSPQMFADVHMAYPGDSNYERASADAFVIVNIPDFNLTVPPNPLVISAGQPGYLPILVMPATNFASTVSLTCGGNIVGGYNCVFTPTSVNLSNGGSQTATLSLTPNVSWMSAASHPSAGTTTFGGITRGPTSTGGIVLLSGALVLCLLVLLERRLRWRTRAAIVFCVICLAVGCSSTPNGGGGGTGGGGPPPSPQPTQTIVTSSATRFAQSTPLTFTATVTGANNPTGTVAFLLNGNIYGYAPLVGKAAVLNTQGSSLGIYVLTAQYAGDALNSQSVSPGVNMAATGSIVMDINGSTLPLRHAANVTVTIQ